MPMWGNCQVCGSRRGLRGVTALITPQPVLFAVTPHQRLNELGQMVPCEGSNITPVHGTASDKTQETTG